MKALYVSSVNPFSGKTALCLALGKKLQTDGYAVGYLKPVSTRPWRTDDGKLVDEDAAFVRKTLALDTDLMALSPVIITASRLREHLRGLQTEPSLQRIDEAVAIASKDKDILLLEGGVSLCEGQALGLADAHIAARLDIPLVAIVRSHGEMALLDDACMAHKYLAERLLGVLFNQVQEEEIAFLNQYLRPFLSERGIRVLGALPRVPRLSALSVGELVELLHAEVLTAQADFSSLAETFTVGAMTADQALSRFRRYQHKAVITGGDRTDIQLAALETSTVVLILTGNLHPSPLIIQQAETLGIPILLVQENTMETVEAIERAYGKTRLGQHEKLEAFIQLMVENAEVDLIYRSLGLA
jgi:BioD-like phosphotransacetylase family protein